MYRFGGRQREMGLGSAAPGFVSLQDASNRAADARKLLEAGTDPLEARKATEAAAKATFVAETVNAGNNNNTVVDFSGNDRMPGPGANLQSVCAPGDIKRKRPYAPGVQNGGYPGPDTPMISLPSIPYDSSNVAETVSFGYPPSAKALENSVRTINAKLREEARSALAGL